MIRKTHLIVLVSLLVISSWARAATVIQEARAAYERGAHQQAIEMLEPLANSGDHEAQFHLGEAHLRGDGTEEGYEKAQRWYSRAASNALAKMTEGLAEKVKAQLPVSRSSTNVGSATGVSAPGALPVEVQLAVKQHGSLYYLSLLRYRAAVTCAVAARGPNARFTTLCREYRDVVVETCSLSGDNPTTKLLGVDVDVCLD